MKKLMMVVWVILLGSSTIYGQTETPVKVGPEFQVNTYTNDLQYLPSIAMHSDGSFVVVWTSLNQDGSLSGVFGQMFDSNGNKTGSEFQVNTYTNNHQINPSIATNSDGSFVVVWGSYGQDGSARALYGQMFDANGNKTGSEFQVNTYTNNIQAGPSIATNSDGSFVVVWQSYGQDGSGWGVFGQRFDANGNKTGSEFQVNTYTGNEQEHPSIAMNSDGSFVVIWQSLNQDGSLDGVFGQRFDANGNKAGSEFQVNTYTNGYQLYPSITMNSDGSFVVVWQSDGQDGSLDGVFGQLFDSNGNKTGSEFQVNTYTNDSQSFVDVSDHLIVMHSDGSFVVVWESDGQDGSGYGIFGQMFDSNGNKMGSEFSVNTYSRGDQLYPSVAMNSDGSFVVIWQSAGQDGSDWGIFGQRFDYVCINDDYGEYMLVPAGEFQMGDNFNEGEPWDADELPVHTVYLDSFYIGKYAVTNAQFCQFLNEEGNKTEGGVTWLDINSSYCLIEYIGGAYVPKSSKADHPVVMVSWYGARAYCTWLSAKTGQTYRLPTEAEWEKAARGTYEHNLNNPELGHQRRYPWGDNLDGSYTNYNGSGDPYETDRWPQTTPVGYYNGSTHGSFQTNDNSSPYGAYDMSGNVWEWCSDWYSNTYYQECYDIGIVSNPTGPLTGAVRVVRGGGWDEPYRNIRSVERASTSPKSRIYLTGFRCVRVLGDQYPFGIAFFDDFEDASIDTNKWIQVSGSGTVTESDGYLKLNYRSGSPPHSQIRTAYDFMQDNVVITVKMKPVYIAGNKNIGFWLGDINTGSVTGFLCKFHSTEGYFFEIVKFHNYDGWGLSVPMTENPGKKWTNSSDFYSLHEAKIIKAGSTYTFYVDGEQIARDTIQSTQPTSLYFSLGRHWMENRWGEYGEVWVDEIVIESNITSPEAPALSLPSNEAVGVSTSPTLSWNSSSGATSYTLQVSQYSNFSSYVFNQNVGNVTSKQITGLSEGTIYYWRVRASNSAGSSEWSNVWSFTTVPVPSVAPDWNVNPPDFASTMTMTARLVIFDTASTDADDIVGAFVDEECRGVGHPALFPGTGDYVINLTVYSNSSGETVRFKAWDNSTCRIFDVDTTITFIPDADYGTAFSPVILPVRLQEIKIPLSSGWTWFSVNASNDDMTLDNVLAGLTPADGDLIKNQTDFSRYYAGYGWWGDLSNISCKEMYMIKLTSQDSLRFTGVECDITPIKLNEGWTWIGYLPQTEMPMVDALQSLTPSEGDLIKNQTGFSTYYSSTGWWGDLDIMLPYDGYKIKMASSGILTYPAVAGGGSIALAKNVNTKEAFSIFHPSWSVNPADFTNTMTMTAQLSVNGEISTDKEDWAGVFVDDECRGVGQTAYFPGNGTYVITLTIYSNISGETLTFKTWDNSSSQIANINETYVFQPDIVVGNATSPFMLTSTATKIEQNLGLPKEFRLYDNYPNPFNPETTIRYEIPTSSFVTLRIYNVMGEVVRTLVYTQKDPGRYSAVWDGTNEFGQTVSSGLYIYRMQAGKFTAVKKMLFIK
ncbi:hypothetical protein AMJ80_01530 [bacterium SM23_31]|nr:MAG: hypothetical protein AMJ80_01530 [bacterium SM23_31]